MTLSSAGTPRRTIGQRLPHRIAIAEMLARLAFGEDERIEAAERGPPVAADERQIEHVEEALIGHHHVGVGRLAVLQHDRAGGVQGGDRLDLREVAPQPGGDRIEGPLREGRRLLGGDPLALHLIGALRIGQPGIVAEMVADEEQDQQAGGEAERQAEDVDEGIGLVLRERPKADRQIVTPHCHSLIRIAARGSGSPAPP